MRSASNVITFVHRPGRHRQELARGRDGGAGAAGQAGRAASSSRGRRSRRGSGSGSCPATSWPRSTPTCARSTTRCTTWSSPRARSGCSSADRRGRAARVHARPHAELSFIILDEAQNTTPEQMKMFLTRIGFGSRSSSPATSPRSTCPAGAAGSSASSGCSPGSTGSRSCTSPARDVVRHRIVPTSSTAYERAGDDVMTLRDLPRSDRPRRASAARASPRCSSPTSSRRSPVDVARWGALAEAVLARRGHRGGAELSVLFVDEPSIAELNERFMEHDGPTDVLAFPIDADAVWAVHDPLASGPDRADPDPDEIPLLLGDVVVCPAVADAQRARPCRHTRRRDRAARRARRAPRARPRPRRCRGGRRDASP